MCRWAGSILTLSRCKGMTRTPAAFRKEGGGVPLVAKTDQPTSEKKTKKQEPKFLLFLAEREGFEPSRAFRALHDFQSCALDQLSHLSIAARPNPNCKGNYNKTGEKCQAFFSKNRAHPNAAFRAQAPASWRTKPHSSFSSVRFSAKALLRKTAYSSAIVAW